MEEVQRKKQDLKARQEDDELEVEELEEIIDILYQKLEKLEMLHEIKDKKIRLLEEKLFEHGMY